MMKRFRRAFCVILAALTVLAMMLAVSAGSTSYIRGDADNDGKVTVLDATAIQRKLAALSVSSFNEKAADVDGNGLDILDATSIQRWLASYADAYQIGETVTVQPSQNEYELPFVPA